MRISDWSSDVCSSDLFAAARADDENLHRPNPPCSRRGSKASRTASPTKTSRVSMIAMAKNPVRPSHGAWRLALPCASSSPSEAEPGGRPKPRKSSAVRVVIEPERSEEHTSELQSLMRISYAVFCLKKKNINETHNY